jgi:3-keto-5-aminohexanoate cleavage enzyme
MGEGRELAWQTVDKNGQHHNPVIITVAPVGHENHGGPRRPDEIVQDVVQAHQAGASIVHLHVRDDVGCATTQLDVFLATIEHIRCACDIVIEGSTGSPTPLPFTDRSVALATPIDLASLNMGSVNFFGDVYVNSPEEVRTWAQMMKERGIIPDCQVFDLSMIFQIIKLRQEGLLPVPTCIGLALGFPDALPAGADILHTLWQYLPPQAVWSLAVHGFTNFDLHALAIGLGGHVRVGLEDGWQAELGSNVEQVAGVARLAFDSGRGVATAAQVRQILRLPPK